MNFLYFIYKTVVKRNQSTVAPGFLQDLGAVELVGVQYAVNRLARADAVGFIIPFWVRNVNTSAQISFASAGEKKNSAFPCFHRRAQK